MLLSKMSNYSLFIDCTQEYLYLALLSTNKIISSNVIPTKNNLTDLAIEYIKKLLSKKKVILKEIKKIFLIRGPGSFTGVRVGVIISNLFNFINKAKIYVLDSLTFQTLDTNAISIINAKTNLFYISVIKNNKNILKPCIVNKEKVDEIINKNIKLPVFKNYEIFNLEKNLLFHLKNFKPIKNLEPLYLKDPIILKK